MTAGGPDTGGRDRPAILVIGVGNELLGDEGLGVHVARALAAHGTPPGMEVLEAGTSLLDCAASMAGRRRVFLVDAVRTGAAPGTLCRFDLPSGPDGAAGLQGPAAHLSLHDWGVAETLRAMSLLGLHPHHLTVVGAEPGRMDPGTELSPELARARDSLVTLLLQQAPEPGEPRPGGDHPPQADHPPHPTGPPVV